MTSKKLTLPQFKWCVRLYGVAVYALFLLIPVVMPLFMVQPEISAIVVPTALAICALLASSIPMAYLAIMVEVSPSDRKKRIKSLFNFKKQSWAILFGESFFVPMAVFCAGTYLHHLSYMSTYLIILVACIAVLAGGWGALICWRCRRSAIAEYSRDYATELLDSDTKVFYDLSAQFSLNAIIGFSALSSVVICFYDLQASLQISLQGLILILACTVAWMFLLLTDRFRAFPHGVLADASIFVPPSLWLLPENMHSPAPRR